MLDYERDRYRTNRATGIVRNVRLTRPTRSRATYRPENNNAIVPIIDIEEPDPARPPSRDSAWTRRGHVNQRAPGRI